MTKVIVDASRIGNAILPDEQSIFTDRLLELLLNSELYEPVHWPIEIANLVLKASRRGRIAIPERNGARESLSLLIAAASVETASYAMEAFELAVLHNISVYDAGYLEMALRTGLPLLTSDGPLGDAAAKAGIELVEV
jgi:predicted nucleic acid-binding protein